MFKEGIEFKTIISIVISAVSVLTPFLYLIGLTYYQGRLVVFGVPSGLFPQSFEGYLVNAYVVVTIFIATIFKYILILAGVLIVVFVVPYIVYKIFVNLPILVPT